MSALLTLRQAVIDGVKTALPQGWDVAGHLGRFTPADLGKFLTVAPAVRVAILALADSRVIDEDAMECTVRLGVYVLTKDQGARMSREESAAAAVELIVRLAMGNRWGLDFAMAARAPTAQTIFNDETLAKGVALWGIDLAQPIVISRDEGEDPVFNALFVGLAPNIGAAHVDDYIGPITGAPPELIDG